MKWQTLDAVAPMPPVECERRRHPHFEKIVTINDEARPAGIKRWVRR